MQRILDVKRDQKRRGRHLGGKRPFGFHIEADGSLTEHEGEQAAIRKAQCGGAGSGARERVEDSLHLPHPILGGPPCPSRREARPCERHRKTSAVPAASSMLLGNIKGAITGTCRAIRPQHASRYLAAYEYRYNRRFDPGRMVPALAAIAAKTAPKPYKSHLAGTSR